MQMTIPEQMTCIEIVEPGGPEVLKPTRRPTPVPGPGEVLIRVAAAGINGPDVYQRRGFYPPPPGATDIPGLEVSGTIVALGDGPGAGRWRIGATCCALVAGGGYAEYCTAPAGQCLPIPDGFDLADAAALPETFFTVWSNVFERAALAPGESLLVHGGSGGIGTTAVQIAAALGHPVFTTAAGAEACERLRGIGASHAIDHTREDFAAVIKEATGGKGVDVILDIVGGDYVSRNIASLARDGRLVCIAFLQGSKIAVDLMPVMLKRLTITGSTLRVQSIERKAAIAAALEQSIWPLLAEGKIRPVVFARLPLAQAAEGHRILHQSSHFGKILLLA
ncbi:MAG: NAD(P)H-quinone oxidoreductase [Rhodospirillales bacterium]|nr:NAD(P)H-quinone oxidoreductase [Rhodospirillales bacterium]